MSRGTKLDTLKISVPNQRKIIILGKYMTQNDLIKINNISQLIKIYDSSLYIVLVSRIQENKYKGKANVSDSLNIRS